MSDSSQVCLILEICQVLKIVMTHGKAMRTIPRLTQTHVITKIPETRITFISRIDFDARPFGSRLFTRTTRLMFKGLRFPGFATRKVNTSLPSRYGGSHV